MYFCIRYIVIREYDLMYTGVSEVIPSTHIGVGILRIFYAKEWNGTNQCTLKFSTVKTCICMCVIYSIPFSKQKQITTNEIQVQRTHTYKCFLLCKGVRVSIVRAESVCICVYMNSLTTQWAVHSVTHVANGTNWFVPFHSFPFLYVKKYEECRFGWFTKMKYSKILRERLTKTEI